MDEPAFRRLQEAPGPGGAWSTAGCCLSLDDDGTITWAAQAARELGWSPEELSGRNISVILPRLPTVLDRAEQARVLQAGEDGVVVVDVAARRDGRIFEAAISLAAKRSAAGVASGLTVIVRDVGTELDQRRSRRLARERESVLVLGRDLAIRHASRAAAELLGLRASDLFPSPGDGLLHPEDRPAVVEAVARQVADPRRVERFVARLRGGDGQWRSVEVTLSNCLADPDLRGLVARLRDVSDRLRSQDEARLSAALHRAMVETSEEGIVVTGADGATQYVNLATARILGVPAEELYGVHVPALLGSGESSEGREEVAYPHPDGFSRILAVTTSPLGDGGAGLGRLLTITDVTATRHSERDLRRRALYDPLTGLPNRYLVRDRLEMAAARQERGDSGGTALLFIDLDGFKPINDTYGHEAGDELLRQVAGRLVGAVRATDTVGRVGGDEFVVICEDVGETGTAQVAARIQATLKEPFPLVQGPVRIDASIGIASSPPYPVEHLVREADAAMYRTKRAGGGGTTVAEP